MVGSSEKRRANVSTTSSRGFQNIYFFSDLTGVNRWSLARIQCQQESPIWGAVKRTGKRENLFSAKSSRIIEGHCHNLEGAPIQVALGPELGFSCTVPLLVSAQHCPHKPPSGSQHLQSTALGVKCIPETTFQTEVPVPGP